MFMGVRDTPLLTPYKFGSCRLLMFFKIGVLKNFANFTCNFLKKRLQHRYLAVKFTKLLRIHFFTEQLLRLPLYLICKWIYWTLKDQNFLQNKSNRSRIGLIITIFVIFKVYSRIPQMSWMKRFAIFVNGSLLPRYFMLKRYPFSKQK